jgi:hypothetical protein
MKSGTLQSLRQRLQSDLLDLIITITITPTNIINNMGAWG